MLTVVICFLLIVQAALGRSQEKRKAEESRKKDRESQVSAEIIAKRNEDSRVEREKSDSEFFWFQFQYLSVYFIVMLADWLQGTNMYTLYKSYNVNVGYLFLTGFLSSAIFGTFIGIYVDKWGRKFGCVIFCILEIVINLLEHIPSMPVLIFGRILGGISTQLLFSAFESWMVTAHRENPAFKDKDLSKTFTIAATGNGITAILAGIIAQYASDILGDIGPFQVAIALTVLAMLFIIPWKENYGHSNSDGSASSGEKLVESEKSLIELIGVTLSYIKQNPIVLYLGLSQAIFEGAVYTFVFMWVPVLLTVNLESASLPTGLIFSSFMLAMAIGGLVSDLLLSVVSATQKNISLLSLVTYLIAALSMYVPLVYFDFWSIFLSFLVLEAMVGMFFAMSGNMRSILYPQNLQSSIMSLFRFPLNVIVVFGTKMTNTANDKESFSFVFSVLVGMHLLAALLQVRHRN